MILDNIANTRPERDTTTIISMDWCVRSPPNTAQEQYNFHKIIVHAVEFPKVITTYSSSILLPTLSVYGKLKNVAEKHHQILTFDHIHVEKDIEANHIEAIINTILEELPSKFKKMHIEYQEIEHHFDSISIVESVLHAELNSMDHQIKTPSKPHEKLFSMEIQIGPIDKNNISDELWCTEETCREHHDCPMDINMLGEDCPHITT